MASKVRASVRVGVTVAALVLAAACGGSSGQFLGGPDPDGGAGGGGDGGSGGGGDGGGSGSADGAGGLTDAGGGVTDAATDTGTTLTCGVPDAAAFPDFPAVCGSNDACVLGFHLRTCCGMPLALGLNHNDKNAFDKAEQQWDKGCAACACPQTNMVEAQDGGTGLRGNVLVKCEMTGGALTGKCVSYFN